MEFYFFLTVIIVLSSLVIFLVFLLLHNINTDKMYYESIVKDFRKIARKYNCRIGTLEAPNIVLVLGTEQYDMLEEFLIVSDGLYDQHSRPGYYLMELPNNKFMEIKIICTNMN